METILQVTVSGLMVGGLYGLAALGLSLVFGVLKVLNVAHGELIMLGGYGAFFAFSLAGFDPFASLFFVIPVFLLAGLLLFALLFRFVVRLDEETRIKNSLLIGFGLTLMLQTTAIRFFTADDRTILTAYSSSAIELLGIRFPIVRLAALVIAVIAVVLLELFLQRSYWGKALRATSEDWTTAALTGIDIRKVYYLTFGLATALAGVTGVLVSVGYSVHPALGLQWTLKALIVVVVAGLGSIRGVLLGGLILGVAEALSAYRFGGEYREIVGLLIFLIVLGIRPQGLFGGNHV